MLNDTKCYIYYDSHFVRKFTMIYDMLLLLSHFSRVRLCDPHRQQSIRLPCSWKSPGKNIGVGCHSLPQCVKVKSESEVTQSCLTHSDPMDCSPPAPLSMGFSRQEYWSGVPLPSLMIYYIVICNI